MVGYFINELYENWVQFNGDKFWEELESFLVRKMGDEDDCNTCPKDMKHIQAAYKVFHQQVQQGMADAPKEWQRPMGVDAFKNCLRKLYPDHRNTKEKSLVCPPTSAVPIILLSFLCGFDGVECNHFLRLCCLPELNGRNIEQFIWIYFLALNKKSYGNLPKNYIDCVKEIAEHKAMAQKSEGICTWKQVDDFLQSLRMDGELEVAETIYITRNMTKAANELQEGIEAKLEKHKEAFLVCSNTQRKYFIKLLRAYCERTPRRYTEKAAFQQDLSCFLEEVREFYQKKCEVSLASLMQEKLKKETSWLDVNVEAIISGKIPMKRRVFLLFALFFVEHLPKEQLQNMLPSSKIYGENEPFDSVGFIEDLLTKCGFGVLDVENQSALDVFVLDYIDTEGEILNRYFKELYVLRFDSEWKNFQSKIRYENRTCCENTKEIRIEDKSNYHHLLDLFANILYTQGCDNLPSAYKACVEAAPMLLLAEELYKYVYAESTKKNGDIYKDAREVEYDFLVAIQNINEVKDVAFVTLLLETKRNYERLFQEHNEMVPKPRKNNNLSEYIENPVYLNPKTDF